MTIPVVQRPVRSSIETKLTAALAPVHLEVDDESRMHSVPAGAETHFKVLVVSDAFEGLGPVDRHRRVHALLAEELAAGLHAISLRTLTPAQWQASTTPFRSPPCAGGSKGG